MRTQNSLSGRKAQVLAGMFVAVAGFSSVAFGQASAPSKLSHGVKKAEVYRTEQISEKHVVLAPTEAGDHCANVNNEHRGKALNERELGDKRITQNIRDKELGCHKCISQNIRDKELGGHHISQNIRDKELGDKRISQNIRDKELGPRWRWW